MSPHVGPLRGLRLFILLAWALLLDAEAPAQGRALQTLVPPPAVPLGVTIFDTLQCESSNADLYACSSECSGKGLIVTLELTPPTVVHSPQVPHGHHHGGPGQQGQRQEGQRQERQRQEGQRSRQ
jgi:hypothetical protein